MASCTWTQEAYRLCAEDLVATYGKKHCGDAEFLEEYYRLFEVNPPDLDRLQDAISAVEEKPDGQS